MKQHYYLIYDAEGKPLRKEITTYRYLEDKMHRCVTREEYEAFDPEKERAILNLKKKLADTDYIACKIAEGAATLEEYAEIRAQREEWRTQINELMGEVTDDDLA